MLFPLANYIHFYNCEYFQSANTKICKRLVVSHVISTLYNQLISQKHWRVTMPYCGPWHFYAIRLNFYCNQYSVSMPYCGPGHFYHRKKSKNGADYLECQCPIAGQVISTPLSWEPVFMRVSEPIFACIFLNCQIFRYNIAKKWASRKLYFENTIL